MNNNTGNSEEEQRVDPARLGVATCDSCSRRLPSVFQSVGGNKHRLKVVSSLSTVVLLHTSSGTYQGRGEVEEHAVEEAQLVDFRDIRLPEFFLEY